MASDFCVPGPTISWLRWLANVSGITNTRLRHTQLGSLKQRDAFRPSFGSDCPRKWPFPSYCTQHNRPNCQLVQSWFSLLSKRIHHECATKWFFFSARISLSSHWVTSLKGVTGEKQKERSQDHREKTLIWVLACSCDFCHTEGGMQKNRQIVFWTLSLCNEIKPNAQTI